MEKGGKNEKKRVVFPILKVSTLYLNQSIVAVL